MTNSRIVATTTEGDFVLQSQNLATRQGFGNVSQTWIEKTHTIDDALFKQERGREQTEDLYVPLSRIDPTVTKNGRFCLEFEDGRHVFPDKHAVRQLGTILGTGTTYPIELFKNTFPEDAEALAYAFEHALSKQDQEKRYRFRIRDSRSLRGVTPENSEWVRNEWYLKVVKKALPGGRISHSRGDIDTIWANVLIPDTIRAEEDSDYGAMLSLSNCEIGKRRLMQRPSLFRAICMNGCIWGQTKGEQFVHHRRGSIDLQDLEKKIVENIRRQVPIAVSAVNRLLQTRSLTTDVAMKPVLAQVSKDFKITKPMATALLEAWNTERKQTAERSNSLFSVVNSFTRAGQKFDNATWVKYDEIGGKLVNYKASDWESLTSRSATLKSKDVDNAFTLVV